MRFSGAGIFAVLLGFVGALLVFASWMVPFAPLAALSVVCLWFVVASPDRLSVAAQSGAGIHLLL